VAFLLPRLRAGFFRLEVLEAAFSHAWQITSALMEIIKLVTLTAEFLKEAIGLALVLREAWKRYQQHRNKR
jgi:hypothetical protein